MLDLGFFDPALGDLFTEADRLVVDGAIRLVERRTGRSPELSRALYRGLLLVAKALRHNHAAVALDPDGFGRIFEQLWAPEGPGEAELDPAASEEPGALLEALLSAEPELVGAAPLEELGLSALGSPFVASTMEGRPAYLSTRRLAFAEVAIARRLLAAAADEQPMSGALRELPPPADVLAAADRAFVNDEVASFISGAMTRSVSVLTGGPGTGKTTAIATLLKAMGEIARREGRRFSIALCAPTAKAAVRMREALDSAFGPAGLAEYADELTIDQRSGSVHRLLQIRPDATQSSVELACDLLIVDEVSMLELTLLDQLLRCAGDSHVVLSGDPDQLVSVEVGAVLRDVVEAGDGEGEPLEALVTRLTVSHRSNDAIVELARAINAGDPAAFRAAVAAHPAEVELASDPRGRLASVIGRAEELRARAVAGEELEALRALGEQVVLCANREGDRSVAWWNQKVSDSLARSAPELEDGPRRFSLGTPIMVLRNESSSTRELAERLSNGDVGVVCSSEQGPEVVFLPVSESPRRRALRMIDQATAAWAFTIHKSQGSEYESVVVSLPERPNRILSRELLYTAVTRAKRSVTIIGAEAVIAAALATEVDRVSGLTDRIRCAG